MPLNQITLVELFELDNNTWNHITVWKRMSSNNSFKNTVSYPQNVRLQIKYKQELALNNPQGLICHKIPTNQPVNQPTTCLSLLKSINLS